MPPAHWISTSVPEEFSRYRRTGPEQAAQQGQQQVEQEGRQEGERGRQAAQQGQQQVEREGRQEGERGRQAERQGQQQRHIHWAPLGQEQQGRQDVEQEGRQKQKHWEQQQQRAGQQEQQVEPQRKQQQQQQKQVELQLKPAEPQRRQQQVEQQQQQRQRAEPQRRQQQVEQQQRRRAEPQKRQQEVQGADWIAVGMKALGQFIATSPEEDEEEENERELSSWLPFSGGGGGGGVFGSEELGDWNPFQSRKSPVGVRSQSPAAVDQSDYGHGGFFTPGIRGSTGNIQQIRLRGEVSGKTIHGKSSSIAQLSPKTTKKTKSGWDRPAGAADTATERRLRRGSLHGQVRPSDDQRHPRHPANKGALNDSSSLIITHSSLQAVQEESDGQSRFQAGAPIVPRASAERATNRSSSSLSSGTDADDERPVEPHLRRKASPARRRQAIRRPGQRPGSATSSRASDQGDSGDELSSWRVPSEVYRIIGERGTSSSDETNPATEDLLYSIFGSDI